MVWRPARGAGRGPADDATLAARAYLPESVALVLAGLLVGSLAPATRDLISADLVLFVLVPGLVFDAAFDLEWRAVRALVPALVGLAVPGVLVSAGVVAVALRVGAGIPLEIAFVVGAITAATDPVAVVAVMARSRMPPLLRTLIEGESLLNDGTGLVLFAIAIAMLTRGMTPEGAIALFLLTIIVSVAAGVAAGVIGAFVLRSTRIGGLAFAVSLVLAYGTYAISALIGLSGVLATVVTALTLSYLLRRGWSDTVLADRVDRAWRVVAALLSAVTFLAIGVAIDATALGDAIGAIVIGVLAVVVARGLIVYVPFALLRGRVEAGWSHVLFWSGLRGAIAFAAALALPLGMPERELVQDTSFGIVLVTLIVQGATAPLVLRAALPRAGAT